MTNQYEFLLITLRRSLDVAMHLLEKAEAHVASRGVHEHELLQASLAPDMFSFTRQIQLISDAAKGYTARLLNKEVVSMPDTESTIAELKARIQKTKDLIAPLTGADFVNSDDMHLAFPWLGGKYFLGKEFVHDFAIPNVYFHLTVAYSILRNQGVEVGKMDFLRHVQIHG